MFTIAISTKIRMFEKAWYNPGAEPDIFIWGDTGGPGKIFGGQWPPWRPLAPPLV